MTFAAPHHGRAELAVEPPRAASATAGRAAASPLHSHLVHRTLPPRSPRAPRLTKHGDYVMTPKTNNELPSSRPEDERPTLPDINVERDEGKPSRGTPDRADENIGGVQRPPADS
jgi:hypothetical protein